MKCGFENVCFGQFWLMKISEILDFNVIFWTRNAQNPADLLLWVYHTVQVEPVHIDKCTSNTWILPVMGKDNILCYFFYYSKRLQALFE